MITAWWRCRSVSPIATRTAAVLQENGVAFDREQNGDLIVGPEEACGVLIEFTSA